MAYVSRTSAKPMRLKLALSSFTLSFWQLQRVRGLLFITGLGVVVAVTLACVVPLYAEVAMSAGLRGVLSVSSQNSDIVVRSVSRRISLPTISQATRQMDQTLSRNLGPFLNGPAQFSVETQLLSISSIARGPQGNDIYHPGADKASIELISASAAQAVSHLKLIEGRLPQDGGNALEIALPQDSAELLQVHPGSTLTVSIVLINGFQVPVSRTLSLPVVGIFKLTGADDPFWHGNDFQREAPSDFFTIYKGLASNQGVLSLFAQIGSQPALDGYVFQQLPSLIWYYRLNPSHISIYNLPTILSGIQAVEANNSDNPTFEQSPLIEQTQTYLPSTTLEHYNDRIAIAQLPVTCLLVLILGLILFFVSLMADLLIDRQADVIALLRSRGASGRQIFGALVVQSIGLGLIALIIGPLLAVPVVYFFAQHTLSLEAQGALNLITNNPGQVVVGLLGFALLATAVAVVTMVIAVMRTLRLDVLIVRREAARSTHRPLWQRLNLDVVAAVIALVGFGFSTYVTNARILDVRSALLLFTPLTLLGAIFFFIGGILLLLRFFPLLLQWCTGLATRSRGAASLLAVAQMARSPRQYVRMSMLLTLASAFAIFTLICISSQSQRVVDVAAYQSGADFSGTLPEADIFPASHLADATAQYHHIPGVTSATVGYVAFANAFIGSRATTLPIDFKAVDASTFGRTALWTTRDSSQPLDTLMQQLVARRAAALSSKVVPAIVDATVWDTLHLTPGASFTLDFSVSSATNSLSDPVKFVAVAEVAHIPSPNSDLGSGVLVDYQSYAAIYTALHDVNSQWLIPINAVWLRTLDDPASLRSVRKALSTGSLSLETMFDRRSILANLYQEPLYLTLVGVLAAGAIAALLLALIGSVLVSWLNVRSRLLNFTVLRAIGASQGQIALTVMWEQCITYTTAVILSMVFGAIFTAMVVPELVFTSVTQNTITGDMSTAAFYLAQSVPPIQIVVPSSLGIALAALVALCIVTLSLVVRVVARSSMGQVLRLNAD
ncbi:MAG TPA: FtsX-like permease family protein [Ktedonobacteraceae bacterium]|nr:FtsX-like permease family protein [Ktedonobacteraceae bacterium]